MEDKTVLITGSTDGIGKQTALELAEMGARVILHGRNRAKVKPVLQEIEQKTGNDKLDFFIADLSSLEQIRSMVHSSSLNFDNLAEPRCFDGWEVYC